jgi:hypothetical protein
MFSPSRSLARALQQALGEGDLAWEAQFHDASPNFGAWSTLDSELQRANCLVIIMAVIQPLIKPRLRRVRTSHQFVRARTAVWESCQGFMGTPHGWHASNVPQDMFGYYCRQGTMRKLLVRMQRTSYHAACQSGPC